MKLSGETITILKNFAGINESLRFNEGHKLRTMSVGKVVVAEATITENLPKDFVLYDLNSFLGIYSIFSDPDIEVGDSSLTIKNGKRFVNYLFADESYVADIREIRMGDIIVEFDLSADDFLQLMKASDILELEEVVLSSAGDGTSMKLLARGSRRDDTFVVDFDNVSDQKFEAILTKQNLSMLPGSYHVRVSKKASHFIHDDIDLQYWVALETDSTFGE